MGTCILCVWLHKIYRNNTCRSKIRNFTAVTFANYLLRLDNLSQDSHSDFTEAGLIPPTSFRYFVFLLPNFLVAFL